MQKRSFSDMECPIAQGLEQIGEWWTLLILRECMLGVCFFSEFEKRLGITATTLTRRLESMIEHGLLARRRMVDHPPRDAYVLTPKGSDLLGVVVLIGGWSNKWLAGAGNERLQFVDSRTGEPVEAELVDRKTKKRIHRGSVHLAAGPKASAALVRQLRDKQKANRKGL